VVSVEGVASLVVGATSTVEGAVEASDGVEPVWAPPLLLTVTPGATSIDEEVEPADDVAVSVVGAVVLSVVVEADTVDEPTDVPVVPVLVVPLLAVPVLVVPALASSVEGDDESVVSAEASPGEVTTAMPMPSAAANAPTRPM
jgi:hypothetical protein